MTIAPLRIGAGKAVDDRGLRNIEIWQSQDRFGMGTLYFAMGLCLHDRGLQRHGSHYMAAVRVARDTVEAAAPGTKRGGMILV